MANLQRAQGLSTTLRCRGRSSQGVSADGLWHSEGCGDRGGGGGGNVRWGQKIDDSKNKAKYRVYMSERTDGSNPNTLLVKDADVLKVPHLPAPLCTLEAVSLENLVAVYDAPPWRAHTCRSLALLKCTRSLDT